MHKKRLLFLTSVRPGLTDSGTSMRSGAHLRALAEGFAITLVILDTEAATALPVAPAIRALCAEVRVVARQSWFRALWTRCASLQARLILEAGWPWPARWAFNIGALREAAAGLAGERFDVVHCFRLQNAALLPLLSKNRIAYGRATLDLDDHESHALLRSVRTLGGEFGVQYGLARRLEALKWSVVEALLIPRFAAVMVCSKLDQERLSHRYPNTRFEVVPNVVTPPAPMATNDHAAFTFLFVGSLNYEPNRDGILFFCNKVLPLLRLRAGCAFRLLIVGRHPDASILALAQLDGVEVVAGPPDIAPYYARADVAVVPIRSGGGTRIKIVEAFSYGVPVVSTTIGAEGLDVVPDRDLLIADDASGLAERCAWLMADDAMRRRVAAAGHEVFVSAYSATILPGVMQSIFAEMPA